MARAALHIQNIFDVLNTQGAGVNGHLKQKCIQLHNRVVELANPGDIVAVSDDCPQAFVEYILHTIKVPGVMVLRYRISRDLRKHLNARSVFRALAQNPQWEPAVRKRPVLSLYMQSPAIYEAARDSGIEAFQMEWKAIVEDRMVEKMNDKAVIHKECRRLGIPVAPHWIAGCDDMADTVMNLLTAGHNPLYIRQTRSAGAFGSITVEKVNSKYLVPEEVDHELNRKEFLQVLDRFVRTSYCTEFVVAELLDLYASPGTLFFVDDTGITVISHTYQILNQRRKFLGFMYPIEDQAITRHFEEIERCIYLLIEPWRKLGYRGYGNVDWMITKDERVLIAELNARQTGVIPPLKIENELMGAGSKERPQITTKEARPQITTPKSCMFTKDRLYFNKPVTFEEAHITLKEKGLLWKENGQGEGIVITAPPSPEFAINSIGIMAIGNTLPAAHEIYRRTLEAFGVTESELLFELRL